MARRSRSSVSSRSWQLFHCFRRESSRALSRRHSVAGPTHRHCHRLLRRQRAVATKPKSAIPNRRSLDSNSHPMKLRHLYLLLCVIGAAFPCWQLVPWAMEHGLNLSLLFQELFATRIGAFFGLDVIVS